jgi:hypothetical protein
VSLRNELKKHDADQRVAISAHHRVVDEKNTTITLR